MRAFYANSFTITSSDDNICLTFEFHMEGRGESLCVVLSKSGAKTLVEGLKKHTEQFKDVEVWKERDDPPQPQRENCNYVS